MPEQFGESRGMGAAAVLFGLALWWLGFFFLRGDLGLYSDDWAARIDPVTGARDWGGWPFERNYFWRPALQVFLHYMFAAFWGQMWVFHLLNAAAHGAATLLLYRLLRRLGLIDLAAFAGAMVFMLFPFNYEVVFWATAMTTGIPTGLAMVLCLMAVRYAKGEWRGAGIVCGFGGMSFFMACWYEQPGAIVGALPCLYMAVRAPGERLVRSAARILAMVASGGTGLVVYVVLLRATAPPGARGASASLVAVSETMERWRVFSSAFHWTFSARLADAWFGGLHTGWAALAGAGGIMAIAAVGVCGGVYLCMANRAEVTAMALVPGERREARARWLWVLAFGVTAFLAAWGPLFVIRSQIIEARCGYFAALGIGAVVAALLHGALRSTRRAWCWPVLRSGAMAGVCIAAVAGSVSMLGWQSAMQRRARVDVAQARQLAERFAGVPSGTVFVPLEDVFRAGASGRGFFDLVLFGWTGASWSAPPAIQHAMRRRDVFATACNPWVQPEIADADGAGFRYLPKTFNGLPADPKGGTRVEWAQTIPFIINASGDVEVVARVVVDLAAGGETTVQPPLAQGGAEGGRTFRLKTAK